MKEVLPLVKEAGMLYWWWCVYFLIFNLIIELSCSHLLSFSLSSNSIGFKACQSAGKHRPYSYIQVYFLTSTNPQSCLTIWQVHILVMLPLVKEAGMFVQTDEIWTTNSHSHLSCILFFHTTAMHTKLALVKAILSMKVSRLILVWSLWLQKYTSKRACFFLSSLLLSVIGNNECNNPCECCVAYSNFGITCDCGTKCDLVNGTAVPPLYENCTEF